MTLTDRQQKALARLQRNDDWNVFVELLRKRHEELEDRLVLLDASPVDVLRGQLRELKHWDRLLGRALMHPPELKSVNNEYS